jgi:hypothetical protein
MEEAKTPQTQAPSENVLTIESFGKSSTTKRALSTDDPIDNEPYLNAVRKVRKKSSWIKDWC